MRRLAAVVLLAIAVGCTTPKSEVAALQVALAGVETLALAYAKLPLCERSPPPCAQTTVLLTLQTHDRIAFAAVQAAAAKADDPRLVMLAAAALGAFRAYLQEVYLP